MTRFCRDDILILQNLTVVNICYKYLKKRPTQNVAYIKYYKEQNMSNNFTQKNDKIFTLDKAETGKHYLIKQCQLLPDIKTRLGEMGLVPNTVVTVIKKAPLGDPIEIAVRGYSLCIRATEAEHFVIAEVTNE